MATKTNKIFMQAAIELAYAAKGKTFPNPAVGAVIVKNGVVVGRGATSFCGGPHAEINALSNAGANAYGAVLYVTLEPCCHHGKTPPCTDAIIAAGIKEVFVAINDPNSLVAGNGILQLVNSGIKVHVGLLQDEATLLNEDFLWSVASRRSWITLKLALTLDGRIADVDGSSRWITGEDSRTYVHELRRRHAAIAVGRSTLDSDNPKLTVRHKSGFNPARIVFSNDIYLLESSFFIQNAKNTRTIIVMRNKTPGLIETKTNGIEYWYLGKKSSDNLIKFQDMAFTQNISSVFIEGGQRVASEFLEAGIVNRLYLFYGNRLLGGGKCGIEFSSALTMQNALSLKNPQFKIFKSDIMVSGIPDNKRIN